MTRAEYRIASYREVDAWLLSRGWRRHDFMGWAFEARGRITHCNLEGAVKLQLGRDARARQKSSPGNTPGKMP